MVLNGGTAASSATRRREPSAGWLTPGHLAKFGAAAFAVWTLAAYAIDSVSRALGKGSVFTPPAGDGASLLAQVLTGAAFAGLTALSGATLGWVIGLITQFLARLLSRDEGKSAR